MLETEGEFPELLINVFRANHVYLQRRTEGNGATLALTFRISGEAPDLGLRTSNRVSAEVVISNMGETVIMRLFVRPFLTRDTINGCVDFSHIRAT